ncbi:hypothetical protein ANCCEY_11932 [Ancylostoma ceylanicum]|uniref:DNA polymerase delta subunit OB-fold domain-containing protein n=2 Tax=Ancylostoma ceylanicum TaxID=53326 RepID=A0A0D6LAE0_9BILA|nr:hypothetical protein ANCCEY_11932 [Ancylostoma ceylanicum]EYC09046.1 hypothetical protein Y032_0062g3322 [Ancylostoma ceylanicum]
MVQSERVDLSYINRSNKYLLTPQDKKDAFERQYNHVYATRLEILKPRIIEAGKNELGEKMEYKQLEDLEMFEKAFVIGTIEKRISKRPSVLKEIAEEELIVPEDYDGDELMSIVSNKDFLEFEDEKQIVKLEVPNI